MIVGCAETCSSFFSLEKRLCRKDGIFVRTALELSRTRGTSLRFPVISPTSCYSTPTWLP